MKLIIAGGRKYKLSEQDINELNKIRDKVTEVVSGGARGVDKDGEVWAKKNNIPIKIFAPNWAKYGKSAGVIRNREMANYADALAIFPGGKGTDNMYQNALKKGIKIYDFRKLKDFKEWIYQEGFGFDWSRLKPKQLEGLFKKSSKEIELGLAGKKVVEYLVKNYTVDGIDEFDIRTAYSRLAINNSPTTIRRKLESILKGPDAEINIKNLASPIIYRKFNIQQEIMKLDAELDKDGVKGLVYFEEEDKPYDLFRLKPINQRQTLKLLKTRDDLLLSVKVFYAFSLAPVNNPTLGKITAEEPREDPYVFNHEKSKLKIDSQGWKTDWAVKNEQIKEIEKNIRNLIIKRDNLADRFLHRGWATQNKDYIRLIIENLQINVNLTKDKFDEICAKANKQPLGYDMFHALLGYSVRYVEVDKQIKEQTELKVKLQKQKKTLSSTYFKPQHFIGKKRTEKSQRFGTVQSFLKEAANAFMKIMKTPVTENQKMVQLHLVENCVKIYTEKNPDKDFDIIVYPESRVDEFGENFNKNLAAEFSFKYGCRSIEINKLPKDEIAINEEGARSYYELIGLTPEKIEQKIGRLKTAFDKIKKSGQIKVAKREHDLRFFIKMYSQDILKNHDFRNKKVLVIDDNTTSGSTFQQISEILSPGRPQSLDFYVPFVR